MVVGAAGHLLTFRAEWFKVRRMPYSLLDAGRVRGLCSRATSHPRAHDAQGALLGRDRLEAAMRPVVVRARPKA